MKKSITLLLLLVLTVFLFACESTQDDAPNLPKDDTISLGTDIPSDETPQKTPDETPLDTPETPAAIGGSDYSFSRKYVDEVYDIHIVSLIVGREACDAWTNDVYLKLSAEEQDALPTLYLAIRDLEIAKEDLKKKNSEDTSSPLSDYIIDSLYITDVEEMKQALKNPLALYYDGEIYTFDYLAHTENIDLPSVTLAEYFNSIESYCDANGLLKYMLKEINYARRLHGLEVIRDGEGNVVFDFTDADIYVYRGSGASALDNGATITLSTKDNSFQFVYSLLSSFIPTGYFDIKDETLILRDEYSTYTFHIEGDTLVFDALKSTKLPEYKISADSNETYSPVPDGAVFTKTETYAKG